MIALRADEFHEHRLAVKTPPYGFPVARNNSPYLDLKYSNAMKLTQITFNKQKHIFSFYFVFRGLHDVQVH